MSIYILLTVASSVLLSGDQGLRMEERPVCTCPHFIDDIWFEIDTKGMGNVLSATRSGE